MNNSLTMEFFKVAHRFKRISMNNMFVDVSRSEFFTLKMIKVGCLKQSNSQGVYVSHIANHLEVTPSAVSRMLRGLEEKELIERKVDRNDRRNTYVCLTEKGEQTLQNGEKQMNNLTNDIIANMGEEDARLLVSLFNKMVDAMEIEVKKYLENPSS